MASVWREAFIVWFRRQAIASPTAEVYQRGVIASPAGRLWLFGVVAAAVVLAVGLLVAEIRGIMVYLGLSVLPIALLLTWLVRTDRYEPEPKTLIVSVVGAGIVVASLFSLIPFPAGLSAYVAKLVAIEFVFFIVLFLLDANRITGREFNDHLDGVVYGVSLGLGYVLYNNFYLLGGYVDLKPEFVLTLALEEFMYVMFPAFTGWWIGYVKAKYTSVSFGNLLAGFIPVALFKAVAAVVVVFLAGQPLPIRIVGVGVLTILFLAALAQRVSWALQDEVAWGYAAGRAPVEKAR
ncbi:MAG: hypothetical protein QXF45_06965 [Candidatus Caldarchaeum sp.]|uniref:PrsW family intramembrane metalloprotease n=1 Tax=Caldiarchaeum subterraneum TaxID=311458 RepID=A0A7C5U5S8_CALS0